jgi:hypothetical protein
VVVYLNNDSPQYERLIAPYGDVFAAKNHWSQVVLAARDRLVQEPAFKSCSMRRALLLTVVKHASSSVFIFDVDNDAYDWVTATEQPSPDLLPMAKVEFAREKSAVDDCVREHRRKQHNVYVADQHRSHGWAASPPYFDDLSGTQPGVPCHIYPRSLNSRAPGFEPTIEPIILS